MTDRSNDNQANPTPKKWKSLKDPRKIQGAGEYPNYWTHKTRSGHTIMTDDSEGSESLTIQHRTGAAIHFTPNGAVQITSHAGKYEVVFGENRMVVTGSHDITVHGSGSLKVIGDYNKTVTGNTNIATNGDLNFVARNINHQVQGDISTQAQNQYTKVKGAVGIHAQQSIGIQANKAVAITSQDSVHVGGKAAHIAGVSGVTVNSEEGKIQIASNKDDINLVSTKKMYITAENDIHLKSSGYLLADATEMHFQNNQSQAGEKGSGSATKATQPKKISGDNSDNLRV